MIHTTGYTPTSREALALAMLLSSFAAVPRVEQQTMDGELPPAGAAPTATLTLPAAPIPTLEPVPVQPVSAREYRGLVDLLAEVEDFRGEDELTDAAHTVASRQLVEAGQIIGRYDAFLN